MDLGRLLELVDEMIRLKVFDYTIAGGEPFLYANLHIVLERFVERRVRVAVLTNCVTLPKQLLQAFSRDEFRQFVMVQVSIDSVIHEVNSKTRGQTERVLSNIDCLLDLGVCIQLASVITAFNVRSAHLIIDHFYPRIKKYVFHALQQTSASLKRPDMFVSPDVMREFWVRLHEHQQRFPRDLEIPSLQLRTETVRGLNPDADFNTRATFAPSVCSAGHSKAEIDPDFNVMGCDIAKAHTIMGNLQNASLEEVWGSAAANALRSMSVPPCLQNSSNEAVSPPPQLIQVEIRKVRLGSATADSRQPRVAKGK